MVTLRIVCVLLVLGSGRAEVPHAAAAIQDNTAADTIYREHVNQGHSHGTGGSYSTHSGPAVSHGGPVVSHGGPVVSHGGPVVSHGGPVVSHGYGAPVSHGGPVVSHGGPVVSYGGPVVSHGYGAPVSHAGPVVSHGYGAPVSHAGPVVSHSGPVVSHSGPVSHAGPVVVSKPQVVHNVASVPVAHAPVVKAPAVSHVSGYQQPVRSQYHAQDRYGQYTFGYNAGTSARDETRDAYGNVRGSFTYIDSYGNLQTQHYVAGKGGFQVEGTNLPVQVTHDHRYKRSYATFPSSTQPLVSGIPSGHVTTVIRHEQGHPGHYGGTHGHGGAGLAHANAYDVSPLLGNSNLHGNFDKYGYNGFSYGFKTAPSSLTTFGTHFNQHVPSYVH